MPDRAVRALTGVLLAATLGPAVPAAAHPVPFSHLDLRLRSRLVEAALVVHVVDEMRAAGELPPQE